MQSTGERPACPSNYNLLLGGSVQRERHDAVIGNRVIEEPTAGGGDHNILPAVAALIGHGSCLGGAAKLGDPKQTNALRRTHALFLISASPRRSGLPLR